MANKILFKNDTNRYFTNYGDEMQTNMDRITADDPTKSWQQKAWSINKPWSYKDDMVPTFGEENAFRLQADTLGPTPNLYKSYNTQSPYKSYNTDSPFTGGMLFEERLANLKPELSTVAEVAYQSHKLDEQNDMIQNAKVNQLRAPITSVAAASDLAPEVLASRRDDINRIRGQYQGADPTMRLISNQMAQQQRDTARGQLNAQRAQHLDQELHRVQQENARNQAASVDTANKNAIRAQQLYDNKLAARVAHSERERELFTKGFGTIMDKLEDRLEGQRAAEAMDLDREMAATNYEAQALGQQIKANPLNYKLKMDLAKKQQHLTNLMRRPTPRYRHFEF